MSWLESLAVGAVVGLAIVAFDVDSLAGALLFGLAIGVTVGLSVAYLRSRRS